MLLKYTPPIILIGLSLLLYLFDTSGGFYKSYIEPIGYAGKYGISHDYQTIDKYQDRYEECLQKERISSYTLKANSELIDLTNKAKEKLASGDVTPEQLSRLSELGFSPESYAEQVTSEINRFQKITEDEESMIQRHCQDFSVEGLRRHAIFGYLAMFTVSLIWLIVLLLQNQFSRKNQE